MYAGLYARDNDEKSSTLQNETGSLAVAILSTQPINVGAAISSCPTIKCTLASGFISIFTYGTAGP